MKKFLVVFLVSFCFFLTTCKDIHQSFRESLLGGKEHFSNEMIAEYPQLEYKATLSDFVKLNSKKYEYDWKEGVYSPNNTTDYYLDTKEQSLSDFVLNELKDCERTNQPKFENVYQEIRTYFEFTLIQDKIESYYSFEFYEEFSCFKLYYRPYDNSGKLIHVEHEKFYHLEEYQYESLQSKINEIAGYDFV